MGKAKKLKVSKQNTVTTGGHCSAIPQQSDKIGPQKRPQNQPNNFNYLCYLSCSAGPLGDQIVRGETAAPTGRNKDRARMDEDEVGRLDYELLLWIQQNLPPKC